MNTQGQPLVSARVAPPPRPTSLGGGSSSALQSALRHRILRPDLEHLRGVRLLRRLGPLVLNPARQLLLALQLDDRVFLGDLRARMACDLAGLDAGAADLLPPRDVGAAERVRAETEEVADPRLPAAFWSALRTPESQRRLLRVIVLWEDPGVRARCFRAGNPHLISRRQRAERQDAPALGRLRLVDVAAPVALFDPDGARPDRRV